MTPDHAPEDEVTMIRLVPLGRTERASAESAIVASFERACLKTDAGAIFLFVRSESIVGRLKVGDIVQWVAEPFGVIWLAERGAGSAGVAE
jgi:hypothetical protein